MIRTDEPTDDIGDDRPTRYRRGSEEFVRSLGFFDATFAIATTLLVTTLGLGGAEWSSWSAFVDAEQGPLLAFALSFVVVSSFWWGNHRFISRLDGMTPRFILTNVAMLGFVALIPFSTTGLGAGQGGEVPTVVYAINIAAVSVVAVLARHAALTGDLFRRTPSPALRRWYLLSSLDAPIVFLGSIPIAVYWSPDAAKYSWLLLVLTGVLAGRLKPTDPPTTSA